MANIDKEFPYSYAGRKPCGCMVAVILDTTSEGKREQRTVSTFIGGMIRDGLTIERVTNDVVRREFTSDDKCPHEKVKPLTRQPSLFEDT